MLAESLSNARLGLDVWGMEGSGSLAGHPNLQSPPNGFLGMSPQGPHQASPLPHQHATGPIVDGLVTPVSALSQTEGAQGWHRPQLCPDLPPHCPGAEPGSGSHRWPPQLVSPHPPWDPGDGGLLGQLSAARGWQIPPVARFGHQDKTKEPRGTCPLWQQDKDPALPPRPQPPPYLRCRPPGLGWPG